MSPDGRFIYYYKGLPPSAIWRTELATDKESVVVSGPVAGWTLWQNSLVYFAGTDAHTVITQMDLTSGATKELVPAEVRAGFGERDRSLSVSPDGRWIVFAVSERNGGDIMLVENFR